MATLAEARKLAMTLRIDTDDDGVETHHLGNRRLSHGDVVLLYVPAGANSQWKEATVVLIDEHEEPHLDTGSGILDLRTSREMLVRWPEGEEAP